eukprot:TRINITY_DN29178_c0_g1_i1.p1 TRINITY_DN29178_c0_g1~~TRINITY_DN29178_c0_g1_i1.p1  ORF type:complete len:585 (+),score=110.34 TRINITY_DN29178_c0_g1_i1:142-1755(+)
MVTVNFTLPNGWSGRKELLPGHPDLRPLIEESSQRYNQGFPSVQESLPPPEPARPRDLVGGGHGKSQQSLALPDGWETANDPESGDPYFFNRATGEVTWERPLAPGPGGRAGGPSDILVDPVSDVVKPSSGGKRQVRIAQAALHGCDPGRLVAAPSEYDGEAPPAAGARDAVDGNSSASQTARRIVRHAMHMATSVASERNDVYDHQWQGPDGSDALLALFGERTSEAVSRCLERLSGEVQQVLAAQPTLVQATLPAKVFGDIHGQFRDMLLLLHHYGFPHIARGHSLIFNGDWVDRGRHQVEVVSLVFALKVVYPDRVWLVRGNHEDACMNQSMGKQGFYQQCAQRFEGNGQRTFTAVHQAFNWLPLGCLVDGRVLCVHGGIGEGKWDLEHLARVRRPLDHDALSKDRMVYNVLWSDPLADDANAPELFGVHDSPRDGHHHMISTFGRDVTEAFCTRNRLVAIVRSHQATTQGYGYDVMHGGKCMRVFSARDYENQGNDGAILSIAEPNHAGSGQVPKLLVRMQALRSLAVPKRDE